MLSDGEAHVWRFELKQPERLESGLIMSLSEEERLKAASLYFPEHRRRFAVGRGMLRTILGHYTNTEPAKLEFIQNPEGKPSLKKNTSADGGLQFSLSHSHDLAICAIAMNRRVGVDLEYVQYIPDFEEVAHRLFSREEAAEIKASPGFRRLSKFYEIWTSREARTKASGTGFSEQFSALPDTESVYKWPTSLVGNGEGAEMKPWSEISFTPSPGYTATIVVEGHTKKLYCFRF
jgi:4'-phosphopantetheinyl transferase